MRVSGEMANDSVAAIASDRRNSAAWTFDEERVFSGDILTPAQFYPAAPMTSCQRLLTAILEDAVHCFQKNCGARSGRRQIIFQEAGAWLFDRRRTGFTSCVTVCETLGIDLVRLRRYLREWMLNKKADFAASPVECLRLATADPQITWTGTRVTRAKRGQKRAGGERVKNKCQAD